MAVAVVATSTPVLGAPERTAAANPVGVAADPARGPDRPEPPSEAPSVSAEGTSQAELSDEARLVQATDLYAAGQYEQCVRRFAELLDPQAESPIGSAELMETARTYYGACLVGAGQPVAADRVFAAAIRDNPQMQPPDSLVFPEAVIERFLRVRQGLLEEIRKAEQERFRKAEVRARRDAKQRRLEQERFNELLRRASTEVVVERRSRWVAALPFGVGQFHNHNTTLGWTFLGVETALFGTFVGALYTYAWLDNKSGEPGTDGGEIGSRRRDALLVATISGWGWATVAAVGVLEAQIAYVPEVVTERKRRLPPELLRIRPAEGKGRSPSPRVAIVPTQGGALLGLAGTF